MGFWSDFSMVRTDIKRCSDQKLYRILKFQLAEKIFRLDGVPLTAKANHFIQNRVQSPKLMCILG